MPVIETESLGAFTACFVEDTRLTRAERAEVLHIAQGFASKDAAAAAGVSPETIRARRKRIYRKLGVSGSHELQARLLALSLSMLAQRAGQRPPAAVQPDAAPTDAARPA